MAETIPFDVLGLVVSGDLGGLTLYQDRFRKVIAFPKSPPNKPPSPKQIVHRARWRQAVVNWHATGQGVRDAYEQVSLACSLCMTGHNLWIHLSFRQDAGLAQTLSSQSGISIALPPGV